MVAHLPHAKNISRPSLLDLSVNAIHKSFPLASFATLIVDGDALLRRKIGLIAAEA